MTNPNWGLLNRDGGFQNALSQGYQMGSALKQRREEKELNNALAAYDPANPESWRDVAKVDPRTGIQLRGQQQQAQAQQMEQRRADMPMLAKLLETATDEASWQRNRQIAQQYGIDISSAPQQFDPAWRDQQLMTLKAISTPEGMEALSSAGKVAADMGFKPGTPEYNDMVRQVWTESQSKPYVVGGETRLYTPRMGAQAKAQIIPQKPAGMTDDQIWAQAHEAVRNGANADDVFRQLQAWGMQP